MKCPSCNNKISFTNLRNEFSCPTCSARIRTTRGSLAIIVAALADFAFFLLMSTGSNYNATDMIIYLSVGTVLSFFVFTSILKLERNG